MNPNPYLNKLGFSDNDRLVIIHTDDIGMCQASVQAFKDLWASGCISSGAAMVPCPWFPAVAQMCRENPEMDMGVHATLNAEWDSCRWGPLSTRERTSGLLDDEGCFHRGHQPVYDNAKPEAVDAEVNAQIEQALAAGIDVTHVDSHMGTIMNPAFIQYYVQAAAKRLLPSMLPRLTAKGIEMMGVGEKERMEYVPVMAMLESMGIPMLDGLLAMPLDHDRDHGEVAKRMLAEVPVGITHFLLHPSIDTPELRALAPDWPARVANYRAFLGDDLRKFLEREGIRLIGYRSLRDAMRSN